MKKYAFVFLSFLLFSFVHAQDTYVTTGKIEFEKKVNVHKEIDTWSDGDENNWLSTIKKTVPQYEVTYFNLLFDGAKTLYRPGKEVDKAPGVPDWFRGPAADNTVYSDFSTDLKTSSKNVYENTFLIQDSVRHFNWRITPEIRIVAGFECHKATTIIMDSIYIIAFYTDQIMTSGGPESFSGLPGMILGLVVPRISTTWFATKLELTPVKVEEMVAPKKGKKTDDAGLMKDLQASMKDWGKYGQRNIWKIML